MSSVFVVFLSQKHFSAVIWLYFKSTISVDLLKQANHSISLAIDVLSRQSAGAAAVTAAAIALVAAREHTHVSSYFSLFPSPFGNAVCCVYIVAMFGATQPFVVVVIDTVFLSVCDNSSYNI